MDFDKRGRGSSLTHRGVHKHTMIGQKIQRELDRSASQASGLRLNTTFACPVCGNHRTSKAHRARQKACGEEMRRRSRES